MRYGVQCEPGDTEWKQFDHTNLGQRSRALFEATKGLVQSSRPRATIERSQAPARRFLRRFCLLEADVTPCALVAICRSLSHIMETEIIAQMDCVPVLQPAVACDDVVESIGKMPPLPACTVAQLTDAEVEAFNPSGPVDLDELVEGITSVLQSDMSNKMTTEQKRDLLLKWLG